MKDMVSARVIYEFWSENRMLFSFSNDKHHIKKTDVPDQIDDIKFKNVSFSYGDISIIKNLNLSLKRGHPIILKGRSGGGKTTVANLLRCLIYPDSGTIYVNGIPITDFSKSDLSFTIGYVTQDSVFIYGTIRDNLLYGLEHQNNNECDDVVFKVLKDAGIYDFIISLPDELNTIVNERGSNLSGGQKQRLSIARILLRNPKVLILDEITNNLDTTSKKEIISTINHISKELICLVITHDADLELNNSTIVSLDK
jgi:ABC-type multidrug transport system fused ATPase/permease subunit